MSNPITQLEQLSINSKARAFLKEIRKWAFFLSILGFVGIGLMLILGLFSSFIFDALPQSQTEQFPIDLGLTMTITYLTLAILYFFPVYYLLQFSNKMKKALISKNDDTLANAFEMLKSHYKFIGVFSIIILSLYAMLIVVSVVSGSLI